VLTRKLEQSGNAPAAAPESRQELPSSDPVPIDGGWNREPERLTEGLDPHAAGIVNVAGDHPDGATGRSWHGGGPEADRQLLEEKEGNAIVGFPGGEDRLAEIRRGRHYAPRWHDCADACGAA
jgi:hypothetical protein